MLDFNQTLKHKPSLVWREVEDGVVIVSPAGGEVRALNQLGSSIWSKLDGSKSNSDILADLVTEFPKVGEHQLKTDLVEFITSLIEREMLVSV